MLVNYRVNGIGEMTTRKRKPKRVPPARVRYEAANPTVSVRISREFHEELEELKENSGLSIADILRAGLDKLKPDAEQFYLKGYSEGYEHAEEEFKVLATCSGCGHTHLPVTGDKMKEAAGQALKGWFSPSCR